MTDTCLSTSFKYEVNFGSEARAWTDEFAKQSFLLFINPVVCLSLRLELFENMAGPNMSLVIVGVKTYNDRTADRTVTIPYEYLGVIILSESS